MEGGHNHCKIFSLAFSLKDYGARRRAVGERIRTIMVGLGREDLENNLREFPKRIAFKMWSSAAGSGPCGTYMYPLLFPLRGSPA